MKKFALALISAAALVFGFGLVANAQQYPPAGGVIISNSSPIAGTPFTVTVNCTIGMGDVTFTLGGTNVTVTVVTRISPCSVNVADGVTGSLLGFVGQTPQRGTSTATFTAPDTPGTYSGTATQGGVQVGAFSITVPGQAATTTAAPVTVPGGGLPATGSSGMSTTTGIAIGLLVVGLGLFVVAQVRRRQPHAAT